MSTDDLATTDTLETHTTGGSADPAASATLSPTAATPTTASPPEASSVSPTASSAASPNDTSRTSLQTISPPVLAVIEVLADVVGEPAQSLFDQFELDATRAGCFKVDHGQTRYTIRLIPVVADYVTNVADQPEAVVKQCQKLASFLVSTATIFYKRLLQEFPDEFTNFASRIITRGQDPEILSELRMDNQKSSLYLTPSGKRVGILVSETAIPT